MPSAEVNQIRSPSIERRKFLCQASGSVVPFVLGSPFGTLGQAPASNPASKDLIVRQSSPTNLEFPFATLDSLLTPNDCFFVRNHFPAPKLDPKAWRLKVEGAVQQPLELTFEELSKMSARTAPITLECSGNGRALLVPKVKGVPWQLGAVSTAEWTGVPLAAVLDKAGLRDAAVDVILEGADGGELQDEPKPAGMVRFARALPLKKALQPEVLLAHRMNGAVLPENHGFPLRAVVPAWYAVASVKWLTRIIITDRPFHGLYQSVDYSFFQRQNGLPVLVPISELNVKAEIAQPVTNEIVPAGKDYRVHGAAWTGDSEVTKVEVTTDGGLAWSEAKLLGNPVRYTWRLWEFIWQRPQSGRYILMARATDRRGRTQPMTRDPDRRNYLVSHVLPVDVHVR
jgi:DMSO/TMAO reductase YedYZ molybdopterin-dependent catalytic subunit